MIEYISENLYCIYKHTNTFNNKIYIGQTYNTKKRWNCGYGYGDTKFGKAIQEFGWENFTHKILEKDLTKQEADQKEQYYIELYNSIEEGYNSRQGGSSGRMSQETKDKLRQINKEKGLWKGNNNPRHLYPLFGEENGMFGKQHSDETKLKISKANKGRVMSEEQKQQVREFMKNQHPRAKKVICIETKEIFKSARQASEHFNPGCKQAYVAHVCNGERKTFKGYHFQWYEEEDKKDDINE